MTEHIDQEGTGDNGPVNNDTPGSGGDTETTTLTLDALGIGWISDLEGVVGTLQEFGQSPTGFILGAVLSELLGGIESIIETFLNSFQAVILGSDGVLSAEIPADGTFGVADVPLIVTSALGSAGSSAVKPIVSVADTLSTEAAEIASMAGPLSPVIYAGMVGLLIAALVWLLRTTISVIADAVPGLQGIVR